MDAVRERPPKGRYGRTADARADHRLRIAAIVLGGLAVIALGLLGWKDMSGSNVSGQVISFKVVSDSEVKVQLEVYKGASQTAVCTLDSEAPDQTEVGRRDVTVSKHGSTVDTIVTIRTTARGTDADVVSCKSA